MSNPDISIIIVSYNVKTFLQHCIHSIQKASKGLDVEIFVVDNNSIDGSGEMVQREFPDIIFIGNDKNLGFGKANNQALKRSLGKYVLFLNPDTLIEENTLRIFLEFMDNNQKVGIAGPKILNSDGSLQLACRRSFPLPSIALPKLLGLSSLFPKSKVFGKYNLTYLDPDESYAVDAISGSFMFCRGSLIRELGGFDEDFFMYGEDLDLCRRVQLKNSLVYYVADTTIIHHKGESSKSAPFDSLLAFYRAMDIFFRKHFSSLYSFITTLFFRLGIIAHLTINFLGKLFHAIRLPLLDGILISASLACALLIRFPKDFGPEFSHYLPILGSYALVYFLFLALGGSYRRAKHYDFVRAAVNLFPGFILNGFFTFFILRFAQSRLIFLLSFGLMLLFLPLWRIFASRRRSKHFQEHSESARRTLVVGAGNEGLRIAATLGLHPELGYLFVGFADKNLSHPKTIGSTGDLSQLIKTRKIDHVIFSSDVFSLGEIIAMIAELAPFPISIKIIPEKENMIFGKAVIESLDDISVIEMEYIILKPIWKIAKRTVDFLIALISILVLAPLAYLSKWLSGSLPVKFSEDIQKGRIWHRKKNGHEPWFYWYPMLFSLLRGEMTIVGDLKNIPDGSRRYYKPGMTSIMRSEKPALPSPEEHERFIHYYMSNFSFVLDVEIVFKTLVLKKDK
ncbi:MAG: glycosyltransferase [Candidatus Marinimicrobia bacterium]|nr:glycosyltransferase [Candidatus Neomarinimicrobiota bacterium]